MATAAHLTLKVEPLALPEVLLLSPDVFRDDRGHFLESWRASEYARHGIGPFVQDNASISRRGVLRGLHFQHPHGQGKLVYALRGTVFDVAADLRVGSPSFGKWVGAELSDANNRQLYVPAGFAHGLVALTDDVVFVYKCTDYYTPEAERTVRWNDPTLAITWPVAEPILSPRDAGAALLADIPAASLPAYMSRD